MKKKLLFVTLHIHCGGIEKSLFELVRNIDSSKYEVTIISLLDKGREYEDMLKPYAKVKVIFRSKGNRIREIINLGLRWVLNILPAKLQWKMIVNEKYDAEIAYAHGMCTRLVSGSVSGAKKLAWIHNDVTNKKIACFPVTDEMIRKGYCRMDKVCAVSNAAGEAFQNRYGVGFEVQPNVIDVESILQKAEEFIWQRDDIFTVVTVGRLDAVKGYDRLLKVHKRLIDEGIEHNVVIVGDGAEKSALVNYISDNDLTQTAFLLGSKDNPYPYIKDADLFVCSSLSEGVSLVLCEAIVLETPVVSTYVCGSDELFGDSEYGLIVDNSEEGIYEGMKRMITDIRLYDNYREKIKSRKIIFDKNLIMKSFEKHIE